MKRYEDMFSYVKNRLDKAYSQGAVSKTSIHYSRYQHIERVYAWMKRIVSELSVDRSIKEEALHIATIFHDVGYGVEDNNKNHALAGAGICEEYLRKHGYSENVIEEVIYLITNHSNKELLASEDASIELIILMEADLLDDTAALGLTMDAMITTAKGMPNFYQVYQHMLSYSVSEMNQNPMVTEPAKRFWREKQKLTKEFIRQLGRDLNI
ncbi:HD domain-containing protein [Mobilitalea sibirica]|nr:HD domain-containing protein [Mobilitalea sibirica]